MRTDEEISVDIEGIIIEKIQPSVAQHGGVVSLQSYKDGVATMFMSGACRENMLAYYVPEVKSVEGVDDQESEVAPYYS
jgi:Fe-S cluster biogenesis protein NfuA